MPYALCPYDIFYNWKFVLFFPLIFTWGHVYWFERERRRERESDQLLSVHATNGDQPPTSFWCTLQPAEQPGQGGRLYFLVPFFFSAHLPTFLISLFYVSTSLFLKLCTFNSVSLLYMNILILCVFFYMLLFKNLILCL